jgi:hypothetical protein
MVQTFEFHTQDPKTNDSEVNQIVFGPIRHHNVGDMENGDMNL